MRQLSGEPEPEPESEELESDDARLSLSRVSSAASEEEVDGREPGEPSLGPMPGRNSSDGQHVDHARKTEPAYSPSSATPRPTGDSGRKEVLPLGLKYHFYVCHKVDTARHIASTLHGLLRSEQFSSWLDVDTGRGPNGEHGPTESNMRAGVRDSACMLLVLTRGVMQSDWCGKELTWAQEQGKPIVCVYDQACKPGHSDYFDFSKETAAAPEHLKAVVTSTDAIPYRSKVRYTAAIFAP